MIFLKTGKIWINKTKLKYQISNSWTYFYISFWNVTKFNFLHGFRSNAIFSFVHFDQKILQIFHMDRNAFICFKSSLKCWYLQVKFQTMTFYFGRSFAVQVQLRIQLRLSFGYVIRWSRLRLWVGFKSILNLCLNSFIGCFYWMFFSSVTEANRLLSKEISNIYL